MPPGGFMDNQRREAAQACTPACRPAGEKIGRFRDVGTDMSRKAVVLARSPGQAGRFHKGPSDELPSVALVDVANRPLLAHALGWLFDGGLTDLAVVAEGPLRRKMREALDACGSYWPDLAWLGRVPGELKEFVGSDGFVVHHADCLFSEGFASLSAKAPEDEADALVVVAESGEAQPDVIDLDRQRGLRGQRVMGAPSSLAVLGPGAGDAVGLSDPEDREAVARWVIEGGGKVTVRRAYDSWRYRNSSPALLAGNSFALRGLRTDLAGATIKDTRIEGAVVAAPCALLVSCVVRGPVVIGARARLFDSYVGPCTSIGREACIEGAEVEQSVILPGASLSHLGTRLEGSVVGRGARVARDFHIPKALRLSIGDGADVSLC